MKTNDFINRENIVNAHNYHPLPVVIKKGDGVWVEDVEGKKYLDMLSAYSALNQGHLHPKIIQAAKDQLDVLTLTSRAFYNDKMLPFLEQITELTGFDKALLMNSGAEAVETAIKAMRRWGMHTKSLNDSEAEIIVFDRNFHGRTSTIISFSSDESSRKGYGPYSTGFVSVPYGDLEAVEKAINKNTVGILVEPIQGEAGVIIPPQGFLKGLQKIGGEHGILLTVDEIQTGLGRTGKWFCYQYEIDKPDIAIVGKALGGGVYPVSGILADNEVMDIAFDPGSHGSTFGGNPMACAIAYASLDVIKEEKLVERSDEMGAFFKEELIKLNSPKIKEVRGKGLLIAIELEQSAGPARNYTLALLEKGLLAKETHQTTIRFSPPLVINKEEIGKAIEIIKRVLE